GHGPYWLHVEMPGNATFGDLDDFLRRIWLECCGHLSAFRFSDKVMSSLGVDDREDSFDMELPDEQLLDYEVAEVVGPKLAFGYEYDFGSTTALRLKVVGIRTGPWAGK